MTSEEADEKLAAFHQKLADWCAEAAKGDKCDKGDAKVNETYNETYSESQNLPAVHEPALRYSAVPLGVRSTSHKAGR